jgi:hypothetical protein
MSYRAMAPDARNTVMVSSHTANRLGDLFVAFQTGGVSDAVITPRNPDLVWKIAGCKSQGMKESVYGFGCVLRDEARGRMAIVAQREFSVARLQPPLELIAHDVAVCARRGIVGEVRRSAGVPECK